MPGLVLTSQAALAESVSVCKPTPGALQIGPAVPGEGVLPPDQTIFQCGGLAFRLPGSVNAAVWEQLEAQSGAVGSLFRTCV